MKVKAYIIALFAALLLASCGSDQQKKGEHETITVTHLLGEVEVPKNPERVVVLDYSALENLDFLGIKPVAVPKGLLPSHLSKYADDPEIADIGSIHEPNLERINELEPDLIIIGTRLVEMHDKLSDIAPVLYPYQVVSENMMASFEQSLELYGEVFGKEDELKGAFHQIQARVAEIRNAVEEADLNALTVIHNQGRLSAYGSGSRFGIIYDALGFDEAVENLDTHVHGTPISNEFIQSTNPDVLFIVDRSSVVGNIPTDSNSIENELVMQTKAGKNGKIFYLNPEAWYLAGGGIASVNIMLEEVAQALK